MLLGMFVVIGRSEWEVLVSASRSNEVCEDLECMQDMFITEELTFIKAYSIDLKISGPNSEMKYWTEQIHEISLFHTCS
jgi:hypothetical protein